MIQNNTLAIYHIQPAEVNLTAFIMNDLTVIVLLLLVNILFLFLIIKYIVHTSVGAYVSGKLPEDLSVMFSQTNHNHTDNHKNDLHKFEPEKYANALLQAVYASMLHGMIIHKQMKIIDVNDVMCDLTGLSKQELLSKSLDQILLPHESMLGLYSKNFHKLVYRSTCFTKNNERLPVHVQMTNVTIGTNTIQISAIQDVREKMYIEEELKYERNRRMRALFDGQEMERRRLAKEIHDGLGQSLIAIRLMLEGKMSSLDDPQAQILSKIKQLIDQIITDVRNISNNLMPSVLNEFGLATAVRQLCDHIQLTTSLKVHYSADCSKFALSSMQTSYLFRIAQEAINNVLKHAKANNIYITISQTHSDITLTIEDDGIGMDTTLLEKHKGNGLYNILERTKLLNGKCQIFSEPKRGTKLIVTVPNWRLVSNE